MYTGARVQTVRVWKKGDWSEVVTLSEHQSDVWSLLVHDDFIYAHDVSGEVYRWMINQWDTIKMGVPQPLAELERSYIITAEGNIIFVANAVDSGVQKKVHEILQGKSPLAILSENPGSWAVVAPWYALSNEESYEDEWKKLMDL